MKYGKYLLVAILLLFSGSITASSERETILISDLPTFQYTAKEIQQKCTATINEAEKRLNVLTLITDDTRTFHNTVGELSQIGAKLFSTLGPIVFLAYVSPQESVRNAAQDCEVKLDKYNIEIFTREDLFKALQTYAQKREELSPLDAKLLEETLRDFKRNGLLQPKEIREKIITLKKALVEKTSEFEKNIRDDKSFITVSKEELDGLPADYIQGLQKTSNGKYKITTAYPEYFPFVRNAKSGNARDRLQKVMYSRAADKNVKLLEEIIQMRSEIASLLGYQTHADYILELRMAKNRKTVEKFLSTLQGKLKKLLKNDFSDMLALKRQYEDPKADKITDADRYYYDEFARKLRYDIDSQKIKEYFPFEPVLAGIFEVYQQILGLHFQEISTKDVWHPDVKVFEVRDQTSNELIGHFYIDLFPREGKYSHAAMWDIIPAHILPDKRKRTPVATLVANFTKPSHSRPSLLTHDEVETFFHEFGHVMHGLLGHSPYIDFSGTNVARDFVEAPSQMLENWVWEPIVLEKISRHYKTGEPLPKEMIKKMVEAKNLYAGARYSRQILYAFLAHEYYANGPTVDTDAVLKKLWKEIFLIDPPEGSHFQASFGHLMGYDASYYGYLWSEVFSADMYSRFQKEGILNADVGREYRKHILEAGGTRDESDLLKDFLGRKPNQKAFLKSIGLKQ